MPLQDGTTVGEAREAVARLLSETGCYDICARCPVYPGGEGCCQGCQNLLRVGKEVVGCGNPNLSCLTYTCGVLNTHLLRLGRFEEWTDLTYGLPREGYRGCQRREDDEVIQIRDPLRESAPLRQSISQVRGRKQSE